MLAGGCLLAAVGIAFGAHGLRAVLGADALGWWQTAVQYQMWNAIGLVALAAVPANRLGLAAVLIAAGAIVFSGSLYIMALTDLRWLGAVTPIGGLLMIAGWILAAFRMLKS